MYPLLISYYFIMFYVVMTQIIIIGFLMLMPNVSQFFFWICVVVSINFWGVTEPIFGFCFVYNKNQDINACSASLDI